MVSPAFQRSLPSGSGADLQQPASGSIGLPPVPLPESFNRWRDWTWRLAPLALLAMILTANAWAHERLLAVLEQIAPGCIFRRLTGISCPGCGGTRAMKALLEGHVGEAMAYNLFWIPTLLVLAGEYLLSWWLWLHPEHANLRFAKPRLLWLKTYALLAVIWFILRNVLDI